LSLPPYNSISLPDTISLHITKTQLWSSCCSAVSKPSQFLSTKHDKSHSASKLTLDHYLFLDACVSFKPSLTLGPTCSLDLNISLLSPHCHLFHASQRVVSIWLTYDWELVPIIKPVLAQFRVQLAEIRASYGPCVTLVYNPVLGHFSSFFAVFGPKEKWLCGPELGQKKCAMWGADKQDKPSSLSPSLQKTQHFNSLSSNPKQYSKEINPENKEKFETHSRPPYSDIYMKSSDAKASKCHLKFSSLMMIFYQTCKFKFSNFT